MRWLSPWYLVGLVVVFLIGWRLFANRGMRPSVRFPDSSALRGVRRTWAEKLARMPIVLRLLALALILVAMARPQTGDVQRRVTSRGVDIVLALDISGSMRARDFEPDRLGAAKEVVKEFVERRKGDRLAAVVFASCAFTLCPATLDWKVVTDFVDRVHHGMIDGQSTALGTGLATALRSLKDSQARSRIVILLTDGQNNAGTILPLQAAEAAKALDVRVYTIGVGTRGVAMIPAIDPFSRREVLQPTRVDIDEPTLRKIAELTGGKYYRATDKAALEHIYDEINELEKSDIEYVEHDNFDERAEWLILPAIGLLLFDLLLAPTRFGGLP